MVSLVLAVDDGLVGGTGVVVGDRDREVVSLDSVVGFWSSGKSCVLAGLGVGLPSS